MEDAVERTLVLVKPDGVERGLVGEIIGRFERKGLKLAAMRLVHVPVELAERHYAIHADKPFYGELVEFITSGPVAALALEGPDAIAVVRALIGATRPAQADPGTVRGDLGLTTLRNLVHASDGAETATMELDLWFGEEAPIGQGRANEGPMGSATTTRSPDDVAASPPSSG